ncbi:hypothetical protein PR202_gb04947 [Eleusine coracana subsp. coracana]|uniref:Uncharacterized protein n=1 Tax=Eleusine coracana subsp. coracana TaxID=191504 RepID=A0AAV5E6M3_ELECO|nr:hypothetical protein PR202_gb04947 [Eleusine coracana subsp. coracana]
MPPGFIGVGTLAAAWWSQRWMLPRGESIQLCLAGRALELARKAGSDAPGLRPDLVCGNRGGSLRAANHKPSDAPAAPDADLLREAMYEGCYLVDTFGYRMLQQKMNNNQVGSHLALTKLSPAKCFCFSTTRINRGLQGDGRKEIQKMLESLHNIINEMADLSPS